jgi:hypothetical protein
MRTAVAVESGGCAVVIQARHLKCYTGLVTFWRWSSVGTSVFSGRYKFLNLEISFFPLSTNTDLCLEAPGSVWLSFGTVRRFMEPSSTIMMSISGRQI